MAKNPKQAAKRHKRVNTPVGGEVNAKTAFGELCAIPKGSRNLARLHAILHSKHDDRAPEFEELMEWAKAEEWVKRLSNAGFFVDEERFWAEPSLHAARPDWTADDIATIALQVSHAALEQAAEFVAVNPVTNWQEARQAAAVGDGCARLNELLQGRPDSRVQHTDDEAREKMREMNKLLADLTQVARSNKPDDERDKAEKAIDSPHEPGHA